MPETTPLIKAALNLRVGAGFDVYVLLAGFLLYFTILGNSFWQKRFLNFFFKNATLFL